MSYQLRLTPDFARQRREWLAQTTVPDSALPPSLEAALSLIGTNAPVGENGAPSRQGEMPRTRSEFWRAVVRVCLPLFKRAAINAIVASSCAALATLAAMRILRREDGTIGMLGLASAYFVCGVLNQAMVFRGGRLRGWVNLTAQATIVGWISRKLLGLSASASARQSTGNLKVLVTSDVTNVCLFLENAVRNLIPSICALLVATPFLLHFSGRAGLVGLLMMASLLPLSIALNAISTRLQARSQGEMDRLATLIGEWIKNIRLIRYLSWQEAVAAEVGARIKGFMGVSVLQHLMACLLFGLSSTWWMVSVTAVVMLAQRGAAPLDLISFFGSLWLLTFLAGYFTHLPNTLRLYALAAPSVDRVIRLLAETEKADSFSPELSAGGQAVPGRPVALELEEVSFGFAPDLPPVLRELSLEIDLSQKLAIIGEIGSGKSTLLRLLCGELAPSSGRIWVRFADGSRRDLWTRSTHEALRARIGYVPQDPFVSSDLFSHNIALGGLSDAELGDAEREAAIVDAAYWAELEADIGSFAGGIRQELGEGGVNLSGGQRQRLNLARARYSEREYLVLDDTLSAVDTATEIRLMERLAGHRGGFALVTHRTGELGRVERVIVLEGGRVVESGSPETLARDESSHYLRVLRAYTSPASSPSEGQVHG